MLNDRDDKFEGQDDSEYHFSDEEVSYEVEPEAPKQTTGGSEGAKESIVKKLAQNKRMLIVAGVVIALAFVFYKILAPSAPPSTEITPAISVAQKNAPINPTLPQAQPNPSMSAAVPTQMPQTGAVPQPSYVTATSNQPVPTMAAPQVAPPVVQAPSAPAQMPAQTMPQPQQLAVTQQPVPVQQLPQANPVLAQQGAQPIVTIQSAPYQPSVPVYSNQPTTSGVEAAAANLNNASNAAINQLQTEYAQRLSDFASQNKALQDQVQTLNARVAGLESQLTQLLHTLEHENQNQGMQNNANPVPVNQHPQAAEQKTSYNVQAIIPGRAWLRSDNGETVTVAEGDMIKDLGRVTKIDPYDGVVEINTGTKMISLAYGTGG